MSLAGTVAILATDRRLLKGRIFIEPRLTLNGIRTTDVAGDATGFDLTTEAQVLRLVTGGKFPGSRRRVIGKRRLKEVTAAADQVADAVRAGTHGVGEFVGGSKDVAPRGVEFVFGLKQFVSAPGDLVMPVEARVLDRHRPRHELQLRLIVGRACRAAHGRREMRGKDLTVAARAGLRSDIGDIGANGFVTHGVRAANRTQRRPENQPCEPRQAGVLPPKDPDKRESAPPPWFGKEAPRPASRKLERKPHTLRKSASRRRVDYPMRPPARWLEPVRHEMYAPAR